MNNSNNSSGENKIKFSDLQPGELEIITEVWGVGTDIKTGKEGSYSSESSRITLNPKKDSIISLPNSFGKAQEFKVIEVKPEEIIIEWLNKDSSLRIQNDVITIGTASIKLSSNTFDAGVNFWFSYKPTDIIK